MYYMPAAGSAFSSSLPLPSLSLIHGNADKLSAGRKKGNGTKCLPCFSRSATVHVFIMMQCFELRNWEFLVFPADPRPCFIAVLKNNARQCRYRQSMNIIHFKTLSLYQAAPHAIPPRLKKEKKKLYLTRKLGVQF